MLRFFQNLNTTKKLKTNVSLLDFPSIILNDKAIIENPLNKKSVLE
jgi:hypothetical protein